MSKTCGDRGSRPPPRQGVAADAVPAMVRLLLLLAAQGMVFAHRVPPLSARSRLGAVVMGERLSVVYPLASLDLFQKELASAAEDGCVMVVKYTQPRCNSCRALAPKLDGLARERGADSVRCFEVNILSSGGKRIVEKVGAPKALPTVSVYVDGDLVFSEAVPTKEWPAVLEAVDTRGGAEDAVDRIDDRTPQLAEAVAAPPDGFVWGAQEVY